MRALVISWAGSRKTLIRRLRLLDVPLRDASISSLTDVGPGAYLLVRAHGAVEWQGLKVSASEARYRGATLTLRALELQTLRSLAEAAGNVVAYHTLPDGGRSGAFRTRISRLRSALRTQTPFDLCVVHGVGYRLVRKKGA